MGVKKIVFHIVNSIKGGSGKSTVSFFLADHFNKREDCKAVIIDLDINGSSWINDHKVENFENNFIQNYLYNPPKIVSKESAHIVYRYQEGDDNEANKIDNIDAYLCDPNNSFLMSECELDLFENLIFVIIKHIITKCNDQKSIHIILDMPPSYEKHADRIVNHLLIDVNSPLCKAFKDQFRIIHHLICASTYSHIQLNKYYLNSVAGDKEKSYSNAIDSFIKDNDYHFVFSINDLYGKIQTSDLKDKTQMLEIKNRVLSMIPDSFINEKKLHVAFINKYDYFYPTWTDLLENKPTSFPTCSDKSDNCFKVVEKMYYEALSDFFETVDGLLI